MATAASAATRPGPIRDRWRVWALAVLLVLLTACHAADRSSPMTALAPAATQPVAQTATPWPDTAVPSATPLPRLTPAAARTAVGRSVESTALPSPAATPTPLLIDTLSELPLRDLAPEAAVYLESRPGVAGVAVIVPGRSAGAVILRFIQKEAVDSQACTSFCTAKPRNPFKSVVAWQRRNSVIRGIDRCSLYEANRT